MSDDQKDQKPEDSKPEEKEELEPKAIEQEEKKTETEPEVLEDEKIADKNEEEIDEKTEVEPPEKELPEDPKVVEVPHQIKEEPKETPKPKETTIDIRMSKRQVAFGITLITIIILAAVCYFTGIISKAYESIYWADANITVTDTSSKALTSTVSLRNTVKPKYSAQATTDSKGEATLSKLVQGTYTLSISKDGYIAKNETLKLNKGHNLLHYKLEKVPPAKITVSGTVQNYISEQPLSNIEFKIGERSITSDSTGKFSFTNIPSGEITLTSNQSGYLPISAKYTVSKANPALGKINLIPTGIVVFASNRENGKLGLYTANYDGTDQKPLIARVGQTEDSSPSLSPDGKKVSFLSTRDNKKDANGNLINYLYIVDINGKNLTKVSDRQVNGFSWTKDSKKILWNSYSTKNEALIYDVAAKKNTQIAINNDIQSLMANPSANKIAYILSLTTPLLRYEIDIANMDGTNPTQVYSGGSYPSIYDFPENTKLIYSYYADNKTKYFTYDMTAQTSTEFQFDNSKRRGLDSPDGKLMAYTDNRDGKSNVFISKPDGTKEQQLTTLNTAGGDLRWSLDSKLIFFTSSKTGENAMYVVSIDGGTAKKIVDMAYQGYGYGY